MSSSNTTKRLDDGAPAARIDSTQDVELPQPEKDKPLEPAKQPGKNAKKNAAKKNALKKRKQAARDGLIESENTSQDPADGKTPSGKGKASDTPMQTPHEVMLQLYLNKLSEMPDLPLEESVPDKIATMDAYFRKMMNIPAKPSSTEVTRTLAMDTYFQQLAFLRVLPDETQSLNGTEFLEWVVLRPKFSAAYGKFLPTVMMTESLFDLKAAKNEGIRRIMTWNIEESRESDPTDETYIQSLLAEIKAVKDAGEERGDGGAMAQATSTPAISTDAAKEAVMKELLDTQKSSTSTPVSTDAAKEVYMKELMDMPNIDKDPGKPFHAYMHRVNRLSFLPDATPVLTPYQFSKWASDRPNFKWALEQVKIQNNHPRALTASEFYFTMLRDAKMNEMMTMPDAARNLSIPDKEAYLAKVRRLMEVGDGSGSLLMGGNDFLAWVAARSNLQAAFQEKSQGFEEISYWVKRSAPYG